ncbi:MAG: hypothetical protein QM809_16135 [Gordonia sp. (in: high G+C Gram-positive bacteria)]|uniref:hypothetical protein n=1 Tax=Gordonia sp. (in: high G+C Gram-positive bacteria) TaxID=84139 RepID=UPI0039E4B2CC
MLAADYDGDPKFLPLTRRYWLSLGKFPTTEDLALAQWYSLAPVPCIYDLQLRGMATTAQLTEMRRQLGGFGISHEDLRRLRLEPGYYEPGEGGFYDEEDSE